MEISLSRFQFIYQCLRGCEPLSYRINSWPVKLMMMECSRYHGEFRILWRPQRSCWAYCFVFIWKKLFQIGNIFFANPHPPPRLSFLWRVSHEFHDLALLSLLPLQPHMEHCILVPAVKALNNWELASPKPPELQFLLLQTSTLLQHLYRSFNNKMTCFSGGKSLEMISQGSVYYVRGITRKKVIGGMLRQLRRRLWTFCY